jgi:gamma-glutamylcyclotransferase (GGCT)/AIG2-like uncharacterized protein YtfP
VRYDILKPYVLTTTPGILYNANMYTTGMWPFIVQADVDDVPTVHGDIITVPDVRVEEVCRVLDAVEGYSEWNKANSLFVREQVLVLMQDGPPIGDAYVEAWVYFAGPALERQKNSYRRIVSGDWKRGV